MGQKADIPALLADFRYVPISNIPGPLFDHFYPHGCCERLQLNLQQKITFFAGLPVRRRLVSCCNLRRWGR
jgi:hypothetical protein